MWLVSAQRCNVRDGSGCTKWDRRSETVATVSLTTLQCLDCPCCAGSPVVSEWGSGRGGSFRVVWNPGSGSFFGSRGPGTRFTSLAMNTNERCCCTCDSSNAAAHIHSSQQLCQYTDSAKNFVPHYHVPRVYAMCTIITQWKFIYFSKYLLSEITVKINFCVLCIFYLISFIIFAVTLQVMF